MKKLFLLAWPIALAAVSCSNEEVVSVNNDANEITFAVTAENATRAADSYCNYDMPADFNVWARVDNKQYFANVHYTREGKTTTYKAAGGEVHFWPQTEEVSFWAAKNHGSCFNWVANSAEAPTIKDFAPATEAESQVDLLYAYTVKKRSEAADGKVKMNFRHALSQVVFKAKVTNPTIRVAVDKIEVCRINSTGTFTYPSNKTDDNWVEHSNGNKTEDENSIGTWITSGSANFSTGQFTAVEVNNVAVDGKATNLTDETTAHNATPRKFANSLLLLPQAITAWVPSGGKVADESGAYFLVYCTISNYSDDANGSNIAIWGSKATNGEGTTTYTTAAVAIPIPTITWAPGRKYIYTFTFGSETTGGYDPETGDDVLIPISLDVTVDDFINVTDNTVWMGPNETPKP